MPAPTIDQIQEVFREVFDDDDLVIRRETTAADVEAWDSLHHVTLMVQIESRFGLRFKSSEVAGLKNVGELVDLVQRYLGA